jgi:hypothetical protein
MRLRHVISVLMTLCALVGLQSAKLQAQDEDGKWSEPAELSQEQWASYPAAAIDPSQVVHVMWAHMVSQGDGSESPEALFYARWDGASWSLPVDVLISPTGGHVQNPAMAADAAGNLHVIWSDGVNLYYSQASALGAGSPRAWSAPVSLASAQYAGAAIAADEDGALHVVYTDPAAGVYYIQSLDGGRSWSWPVEIWSGLEEQIGADAARVAIDAADRIHVVWTQITLPNGYPPLGVLYSRSTDGGDSWSTPVDVADESYAEGNILTMGQEVVHLTWHGRAGVGGTFHQWSEDGGETWSAPIKLCEGAGLVRAPALALDSAGAVHLAAICAEGLVYHYWQEGTWSAPETIDRWSRGYEPDQPALVVSGGNELFVLWVAQGDEEGTGVVRYSSRQTSAPRVLPKPLAKASPLPTATIRPTARPSPTATPLSHSMDSPLGGTPSGQGLVSSVMAGIVPVVLLVCVILFVRIWWGGRHAMIFSNRSEEE